MTMDGLNLFAASREIGIVNLPRMLDGRSNEEK
mgnify:CR=1 FL=1